VIGSARFITKQGEERMARRSGLRTQAPKQVTLLIASILWLIGLLGGLGMVALPNNLGFWSLVIAGALLILGSLLDGL
jgi:phosphatidylglycerophosphate synthase